MYHVLVVNSWARELPIDSLHTSVKFQLLGIGPNFSLMGLGLHPFRISTCLGIQFPILDS